MSLFKNAICSTLVAAGTSIVFGLSTPLAALSVLAAGTTAIALPKLIDGVKSCMGSCKKKSVEFKDYSVASAKGGFTRASSFTREATWACSPTNPEQNVLLGSSIGYATGAIASELFPLVTDMPPPPKTLIISGASALGAAAGHLLSQERINRWTTPSTEGTTGNGSPRKALPTTPDGAASGDSTDKRKKSKTPK